MSPLPCKEENLPLGSSWVHVGSLHTTDVNSALAPECGVMVSAPLGESRHVGLRALTSVNCYLRGCNANLGKWKLPSEGGHGCFAVELR